jgi:MFS family permease
MVAQMSALYLLTTHGVLHLTDVGFTRMQSASAIGNLVLFSGFARLPMGLVGDRIEPRWIMTVAFAGMAMATVGIWQAPGGFPVVFAIMSIFGFCFGSIVPIFPTILGNYFGPSAFAPITGFLSPILIVICAPVPLVAGMIHDRLHSYDIAFIYVVVLTLVAMLLGTALVPPTKKTPPPRKSGSQA